MKIRFTLNGREVKMDTNSTRRLIDVLREDFGLTGVKEGCGEGECGTCSVLVDGKLVPSCIVAVGVVEESTVLTIEGYRTTRRFEVVAEAFAEAGAVQCGFCTPGMILAAEALLRADPDPGEARIREAISGNLCRCTGYNMIVDAVRRASREGEGQWP